MNEEIKTIITVIIPLIGLFILGVLVMVTVVE